MEYYHFTNWAESDIKKILNKELKTPSVFSYYWLNQLRAGLLNNTITLGDLQLQKDLLQLRKECIFELLRADEYPDRPSRLKCMFLFDKSLSPDKYRDILKIRKADRQLVVVETVDDPPKLLQVDMALLNKWMITLETIIDVAREYWKGTEMIHSNTEILYEGRYMVKEFIPEY